MTAPDIREVPEGGAVEPVSRDVLRTLEVFARMAHGAMKGRLRQKANVWGDSWRSEVYTDAENVERLRKAVEVLIVAVDRTRSPDATWAEMSEPWKRAADVANQAFMLADPLRRSEPRTEAPR